MNNKMEPVTPVVVIQGAMVFGITGEGVKKRLDTGQTVHVRVDPATRSAKDAIVVKKIWQAA